MPVIFVETPLQGVFTGAERAWKAIENTPFENKKLRLSMGITVSAGVSTFLTEISTAERLFDEADKALLQAKREGKNRVCAYMPNHAWNLNRKGK